MSNKKGISPISRNSPAPSATPAGASHQLDSSPFAALHVSVCNNQSRLVIDKRMLVDAVRAVLAEAGIRKAQLSVAIVDDPTIHELNRRFLEHDYPTDVLSFPLKQGPQAVEGEVIVSADTAISSAAEYGWPAEHELLLYVVHGTLHLAGYDDDTPRAQAEMRSQERLHLGRLGLSVPYDDAPPPRSPRPSRRGPRPRHPAPKTKAGLGGKLGGSGRGGKKHAHGAGRAPTAHPSEGAPAPRRPGKRRRRGGNPPS